jgi:hypothetical protein
MDALTQLMTSFGVSAPAGLNAYLALLIVGLGGRINWIELPAPYNVLQATPVLIGLLALLTIEIFLDKIPALDTFNDVVGTVVRPAAGAFLFAGSNEVLSQASLPLSLLLGALGAGGLHAFKASTRPVWTASTGGLANPVVSVFEDLVAAATVVLGMLAPALAVLVLALTLGLTWQLLRRLRRGLGARGVGR